MEEETFRLSTVKESMIQCINNCVNNVFNMQSLDRAAREISDVIFSSAFLNGAVIPHAVRLGKKWMKQNVFSPHAVLKKLNMKCVVNYEGVESL